MGSLKTLFVCALFVILWSSGWIGAKYGQAYAGVFTLLTYRYILVVLLLLAFVTLTKSWRFVPRRQLLLHASVGILSHAVFLGAGNSALLLGVSAGLVALITTLQPMITATLSSAVTGERASYRQWAGLALGFAATTLVIADKIALQSSIFAYSLPVIAVLALCVGSLMDRRISLQNQSNNQVATPLCLVLLIHCTSALLVIMPFAFVLENFEAQWGQELFLSVLWLALVVSIGAYGMRFFMLRIISAIKVANLEYLTPPTTMLIAYFVFGETLSLVDLTGILLAGIAVWLVVAKPGAQTLNNADIPIIDPILRPPKFSAQGFMSNVDLDGKVFVRSPVVDIDLCDTSVFQHKDYSVRDQQQHQELQHQELQHQELRHPESRNQELQPHDQPHELQLFKRRVNELELQLEEKNQEIRRLNEIWKNLHDSQSEISKLKQNLAVAESHMEEQRLNNIELGYLCERLNVVVRKQYSQEIDLGDTEKESTPNACSTNKLSVPSGNCNSNSSPTKWIQSSKTTLKDFLSSDFSQELQQLSATQRKLRD